MKNQAAISTSEPTTSPAAAKDAHQQQGSLENELNLLPAYNGTLQCKLSIGAPDDPLEREADEMADTIMRMPENNFIQRKCSHCEEEEKVQRKSLSSFLQCKESSTGNVASETVSSTINASRGSGSVMDSSTQAFMQNRFGVDFGGVKIHTGNESVQMNRELNAKAFTVGNDIFFNQGQYNPDSVEGKYLLAHELTHTVQQGKKRNILHRKWDPVGTNCIGIPAGVWLRSVVVNQEIPQSVTLNWSDGTNESAVCSAGKGQCCADTSDGVACDTANSRIYGTNCTPISTSAGYPISDRYTNYNGWEFWNTFVGFRGIALHQHHTVTGEPLSHGCVRLERETARKIFCGARQNTTKVHVVGYARPYCSSPQLQAEWLADIAYAQTALDGESPAVVRGIRETRTSLRGAFGASTDTVLDTTMAGINASNIASRIPRCRTTAAIPSMPSGSTVEEQRLFTEANQVSQFMSIFSRQMIALESALRNSNDIAGAQAAVDSNGAALWQAGLGRAQNTVQSIQDDRPLYWARLRMIEMIRSFNPRFTITANDRHALVDRFEQSTRGISGTTPFAGISSIQKKILISGFDPFTSTTSGNPSGAIIQALSGQSISSGSCSAMIHGVILPVRYREFDQGMIEQFFSGFLSGANRVDMIMTISLSPGRPFTPGAANFPTHGNLYLDHWAARQRGGYADNNAQISSDATLESNLSARYPGSTSRQDEFISSGLPFSAITSGNDAEIDSTFEGRGIGGAVTNSTTAHTTTPTGLTAIMGSGGDFLSNEIFYRVRLLQLNQTPINTIPMGHLHVPNATVADYPALIVRVRQLLQNSLTNLCATH